MLSPAFSSFRPLAQASSSIQFGRRQYFDSYDAANQHCEQLMSGENPIRVSGENPIRAKVIGDIGQDARFAVIDNIDSPHLAAYDFEERKRNEEFASLNQLCPSAADDMILNGDLFNFQRPYIELDDEALQAHVGNVAIKILKGRNTRIRRWLVNPLIKLFDRKYNPDILK